MDSLHDIREHAAGRGGSGKVHVARPHVAGSGAAARQNRDQRAASFYVAEPRPASEAEAERHADAPREREPQQQSVKTESQAQAQPDRRNKVCTVGPQDSMNIDASEPTAALFQSNPTLDADGFVTYGPPAQMTAPVRPAAVAQMMSQTQSQKQSGSASQSQANQQRQL